MLKLLAPAKINLVLEVLGKRTDGYHDIRSIVQTVNLCDVLYFSKADDIIIECDEIGLSTPDNLVFRAANLIKEISGYSGGVKIKLEKHIPVSVGLGGGSSDAATTLVGLNNLWQLGLHREDLSGLAAKLGSDVPLFIFSGTAIIEGRGEKVTPLPRIKNQWFVILKPDLPVMPDKTKNLYSRLNRSHFTNGIYVDKLLESFKKNGRVDPSILYNAFDAVAFDVFPGIEKYWKLFKQAGAENIHLAGSGPAMFCVVDKHVKVKKYREYLQERGYIAYSVAALPISTVE